MMLRHFTHTLGIRGRLMLLTVFPLLVMTALLGYHLIDSRLEDHRRVLVERGSLMVRHLALASEFGLFSHDSDTLGSLVEGLVFDDDVLWAAVLDREKRKVASGGPVAEDELRDAFTVEGLERHSPALFMVPVGVSVPALSDFGSDRSLPLETGSEVQDDWPLGWAVVRLSLHGTLERRRDILTGSLLLIALGLALSVGVALSVGKSITRPLLGLTRTVAVMRGGDLSARVAVRSGGEISNLEVGFNEMAHALQTAQEHLEGQVNAATSELQQTVAILQNKNSALRRARLQAVQASQEKAEFLARMSHEIRTPLNAVIGFSRLLKDNIDARETEEYTRMVEAAANQLLCLVDDILMLSRLDSGKAELESIEFDLPACLEDVVYMLSPAAHDKELELVLLLHNDLPGRMSGDPNRISQVLTNLLNNAIKFTEEGHVFVEAGVTHAESKSEVHISVADTGIGLAEDEKENLFQPFTQADSSVTRRFGGTGLGLAIAERLVSLMGGSIGVESKKRQGSTFHFSIPCQPSQTASVEHASLLAGRRVLLYDAQPLALRALRVLFLRWGMSVFNTNDFEQVPELVRVNADAGTPCDLLVIGLTPQEHQDDNFQPLFSRIRDCYRGPLLLLVGSGHWSPPAPIDTFPCLAWTGKPARRSTLQNKVCRLLGIECGAERTDSVQTHQPPPFAGLRILSAEDNEFNRLLLRRMLEERGATLCEVCTGAEAIEIVHRQSFDLILMDIHMPDLDGITAARRIRSELGPNCPAIISVSADVLASANDDTRLRVFDANLVKPVVAGALEQVIPRCISQKQGGHSIQSEGINEQANGACEPPIPAQSKSNPKPLLPADMQEELFTEIHRLCAEITRLHGASDWKELAELAHQLRGMAGLYGLDELVATAQELEQSARNNAVQSIPQALRRLNTLVTAIPNPNQHPPVE